MSRATVAHSIRAIGIDPGLAATGYAVIGTLDRGGELSAWGALKTSSQQALPCRLQTIYQAVQALLQEWRPALMVIEDVYVLDRFPKAAIQLGEVRGVIYLAAQNSQVDIMKVRPTEVKTCLTGNGRAGKQQVQRAVQRMIGLKTMIKPDHASDAAALALVGLSRKGYFGW
jgi:crossover junction endodeoxyribonuclease RuvC